MPRVLLTIKEVADLTGLSTVTLYRWARTGAIPAKKVGTRNIRFDAREIDAWIARSNVTKRRTA